MNNGVTALDSDPGDPIFVEVAERLRVEGNLPSALAVALRGLSANPSVHKGRLVLAHVLYQMECLPFAVKELQILSAAVPESESVRKLLLALAPDSLNEGTQLKDSSEGETIAATEFDLDDLELLESKKDKD